jgi:hypothetical protein
MFAYFLKTCNFKCTHKIFSHLLINKYVKDFECLPGKGLYEEVNQLRNSISEIVDIVAEDPEILNEKEYMTDLL